MHEELVKRYVECVENSPQYPAEDREHFRMALRRDAKRFIDALIAREETQRWIRLDEWQIAVETYIIMSRSVHDPHDWDHVTTVIELTEYIVESR
jgi:hypothetical protein